MTSMHQPNPEAEVIREAVERYLKQGGTITQLDIQPRTDVVIGVHTMEQRAKANRVKEQRHRKLYKGEWRTHKEIEKLSGMPWETISSRMKNGMTIDEAIETPLMRRR